MSPEPSTILISGPTSGIGLQIARDLGAMGARLILACRDAARGERVAAGIRSDGRAADVSVLTFDAASAASIRQLAATCARTCPRIDVLVNNAGVANGRRLQSAEGVELTL